LAAIIDRFRLVQFLYDYVADERLAFRLNQVMRRVRLAELPGRFVEILPAARRLVATHRDALLTPPPTVHSTPRGPLAMLAGTAIL
jgi:hypothetical protein